MGKKCSIKNVVELFSIKVGSVIWVWGVKSAFDILVVLGFSLVCFGAFCYLFGSLLCKCFYQMWYVYFSKNYELEKSIQRTIKKNTGRVSDVVIKDGKVKVIL